MIELSSVIKKIKPSATQAAAARAAALKEAGRDIISLTLGEPDFDTPEHVKEGARQAMAEGHTRYTKVGGIDSLKESIIARFKKDYALEYKKSELIVTNGAKQSIAAACAVTLNPGDEVVIPAPYWTSYPEMVMLAGAEPVSIMTTPESGYLLSPEQLKEVCTEKTRMIILCSPSNPTGGCYKKEDLRALADAAKELPCGDKLIFLCDEVYDYFSYEGHEHVSFPTACAQLREQTILVNAFSKAYAMTGWRVGFCFAPEHIIKAMSVHQSQFVSNVCSIAQHAAACAYEDGGEFPKTMVKHFSERREMLCQGLAKIPGLSLSKPPLGAFYIFFRVEELFGKTTPSGDRIQCAMDFVTHVLENHGVAMVPGEAFGDAGAVRLSFASSLQELEKGLARISEAVSVLS